ncbi:HAD-IC family P-type ATPase [Sphingobium sp. D43FB]|uniref:HAD-IC family P-type ATPase n=1 Tax=Sphingobium sp. D43FB TaxID=2017595 RepID=UPI000BB553BC|nr:HAD-IC family P-type ATPase [Sphingobium sp. D43FB]PBN42303.1 carbonate dehydratase [Sphingobium sp. D43FB]
MKPETSSAWHASTGEDVISSLDSDPAGLSQIEVEKRLRIHGPNTLPVAAAVHPLLRFLAQFNNALIYFLLAAAFAAALLGHLVDASVIVAVVLVNAIVGFVQEGRAEHALGAIRDMIAPQATVLRDGARRAVAVPDLVPGDIVMLEAGDRVPADLRLLRARGLLIDEAPLTGESVAVEKDVEPVDTAAGIADQRNMAFSGTLVAAGRASGVVAATGVQTQIGRISSLLQAIDNVSTPLLRQINRFARRFTWLVMAGAVLLFGFAVLVREFHWVDALIAVVALAVGIVPEGLPAVITITLAIGVQRMAVRNAVIRRLPAVETLGATSVICSDKTGTLTRNEMMVRRVLIERDEILVGGSGYAPEGGLTSEGADDDASAIAAASAIIRCGLLCNDAALRKDAAQWKVDGDPMEGALVALAMKAGFNPDHLRGEWQRIDEIPFDPAYRFMATLHADPAGGAVIFVKGAPEAVMAITGVDPALWEQRIGAAAEHGERLLGFAMKRLEGRKERLSFDDLSCGGEFLGMMGFIDPPREEAKAAIAECRSAGIAVKMITGDHLATALSIARQLRLSEAPRGMTGAELELLSDDGLAERVLDVDVFARTSPEHKLRIVRALQSHGLIVAMTGDGVNDAPSLKQADVGTAMGHKGTEAAKEAAQMVLLDDNFASIVAAVREGRTVYDNIRKVITWTLPSNGGETVAVVLAILIGFTLPMTATQILWINLILAVTLGLVLAFEPSEPGTMTRRPRSANAPLLSPFLLWRVLLVSVLLAAISLGLFFHTIGQGRDLETARTMVVNMLVVAEIFYLFNVRYLHMRSMTWRGALGTPAVLAAIVIVIIAQLLYTYAPFMQAIFESRPLRLADGALIVGLGVVLFLFLEAEKLLMRRLGWFEELL